MASDSRHRVITGKIGEWNSLASAIVCSAIGGYRDRQRSDGELVWRGASDIPYGEDSPSSASRWTCDFVDLINTSESACIFTETRRTHSCKYVSEFISTAYWNAKKIEEGYKNVDEKSEELKKVDEIIDKSPPDFRAALTCDNIPAAYCNRGSITALFSLASAKNFKPLYAAYRGNIELAGSRGDYNTNVQYIIARILITSIGKNVGIEQVNKMTDDTRRQKVLDIANEFRRIGMLLCFEETSDLITEQYNYARRLESTAMNAAAVSSFSQLFHRILRCLIRESDYASVTREQKGGVKNGQFQMPGGFTPFGGEKDLFEKIVGCTKKSWEEKLREEFVTKAEKMIDADQSLNPSKKTEAEYSQGSLDDDVTMDYGDDSIDAVFDSAVTGKPQKPRATRTDALLQSKRPAIAAAAAAQTSIFDMVDEGGNWPE